MYLFDTIFVIIFVTVNLLKIFYEDFILLWDFKIKKQPKQDVIDRIDELFS